MSEISFSSIYDGVSLALHAAFPSVQVHGGNVKQGLNPGDLNVIMPSAGNTRQVGTRFLRTPTLDVIYYPKEGRRSAARWLETLVHVLEDITTRRGTSYTVPAANGPLKRVCARPRGIRPPRLYPQRAGPHGNLGP